MEFVVLHAFLVIIKLQIMVMELMLAENVMKVASNAHQEHSALLAHQAILKMECIAKNATLDASLASDLKIIAMIVMLVTT